MCMQNGKNMKTTFTKPEQNFLASSFQGDGKYYTTEQGSRHYRNTVAGNFFNRYPKYVTILNQGNDAPRGGATGNFVIVEFTPIFHELLAKWRIQEFETNKSKAEIAAEKLEFDFKIQQEASSVIVDEVFRQEIQENKTAEGAERSNKDANSFNSLLKRQGKNGIETDFWKVFKIVKNNL